MKKFFKDFGDFIKRGNVLDLAVAVIIGGAFGKIVTSLVNHILMPIISLIIGENGFEDFKYVIKPADPIAGTAENAILYGLFIQNIIDFLIIAFVIFIIIRLFNRAQMRAQALAHRLRQEEERIAQEAKEAEEVAKALEPAKPTVEELLTNIQGLLEQNLKK